MDEHIFPLELEHWEWVEDANNQWQYPPWFEGLKEKARKAGIWNWFLPKDYEKSARIEQSGVRAAHGEDGASTLGAGSLQL